MNNYRSKYNEIIVAEDVALDILNDIYQDFHFIEYHKDENIASEVLEQIKDGIMRGIIEIEEKDNKWSIKVKLSKSYDWGGKAVEEIELFEPLIKNTSDISREAEYKVLIQMIQGLVSLREKELINKLGVRELHYITPCALLLYGALTPDGKKYAKNLTM